MNLFPHFIRILYFKLRFKKLGRNVFIDHWCYFRYPTKMIVGSNVAINRGCKFFCSYFFKNVSITLGNNVVIGPDVCFFSASHNYTYLTLPDTANNIIISDNVWIGGRTIILPGVKIGTGSVIGAGSVVTKNIPEWSIAVGNPAKVIKKRILSK